MLLDLLNVIATAVLAFGALMIAKQANAISTRSVRVEVDKHIFEWGQRCLNCLSRISSLRLISESQIEEADFRRERRDLKAELHDLQEEGMLFFEKEEADQSEPALVAIKGIIDCLNGNKFEPPKKDDYEQTRKPQNDEIRRHTRAFIAAVQSRVGDEWSLKS